MNKINIIKGRYHSPHVYFILTKDVIYIGETQVIPIKRWSSHLGTNGSFTKKLEKYLDGTCASSYMDSVMFCSYSCFDELTPFQGNYCGYKIPTQALEHKLHEIIIGDKTFGTNITVLSETVKTAPRYFYHWNEVAKIANKIVNKTKDKLAL